LYIQDENFGKIIDYDYIRDRIPAVYDEAFPHYNLLASSNVAAEISNNDPNGMITIGASALAYSILISAGEEEMAANLKNNIFTLGWTEEHCGSDLLSIRTQATKLNDDPEDREYHIKGKKWMINCSFHADYHVVLAKLDPTLDGPRSLSFFLVPRSSCVSWNRLDTHVLKGMVLTEFEIDGPGTLVGKAGHGLTILQQMAMPSKYQCTYMGVIMMYESVPASIDHLGRKVIFGNNPLQFSNVLRQMYDVALKASLYDFIFHRSLAFNENGWLQFHGTFLKSFLLLRINEMLSKNLLIAGSKGFVGDSPIGRDAFDSFVLPVFDGHYTINTLMSAKHIDRYLNATDKVNLEERMEMLRNELFVPRERGEIETRAKDIRKPPFFDLIDYADQFNLPIDGIDMATIIDNVKAVLTAIDDNGLSNDPDHKYKTGDLQHWVESIVAAMEFWKVTEDDNFLNAVIMQYNGFVNAYNAVIAESAFDVPFLTPLHYRPLPENIGDPVTFLKGMLELRGRFERELSPAHI